MLHDGPAAADTGKRGGPDRPAVLMETWRRVIATVGGGRLVIGGKSMGGRIARGHP